VVADEAEKVVHAHAAFSSLAILPVTCCDPPGVVAALLTVFAAFSKGS
jgi:hypothetical protein